MKKVYLSGPITGLPGHNRALFEEYKKEALKKGAITVVVPHELFDDQDTTDYKWEDYMKGCIRQLLNADVILMLPGWADSKGAVLESEVASATGIPRVLFTELTEYQNGKAAV